MGMYERQYLGMYIELEYNHEFINVRERSCENGHEVFDKNAKFCSSDGSKITTKDKRVSRSVDVHELIDAELIPIDYDDFCIINIDSSDKTWLIQNLTTGKYGLFLDDADYGAVPLSIDAGSIVDEFYDEFEMLLSTLRTHCKSVKVGHGLVKYYN